jgi:hypothetical protein
MHLINQEHVFGSQQNQPVNPIKFLFVLVMSFLALGVTLSAFFSGSSRARDEIRIKDVTILNQFIIAYKNNEGSYPASSNGLPLNWQKYLDSLPVAPKADGHCSNVANDYSYKALSGGQSFQLSFCLGKDAQGFPAGSHIVGPDSTQ